RDPMRRHGGAAGAQRSVGASDLRVAPRLSRRGCARHPEPPAPRGGARPPALRACHAGRGSARGPRPQRARAELGPGWGARRLVAASAAAGCGRVPAATLGGVALFALCYCALLRRVSRAGALRWGIAFLFGLVHGFGFAAVLIEARLPTERLVPALFGFNAGV